MFITEDFICCRWITDKDIEIVHHGESGQLAPCPEPGEQHHRGHSAGHAILFPTG